MVYDNTHVAKPDYSSGEKGYAIHKSVDNEYEHTYNLYTDDGRGNGDYIAGSDDVYWIRRIAHALDLTEAKDYDYSGDPK